LSFFLQPESIDKKINKINSIFIALLIHNKYMKFKTKLFGVLLLSIITLSNCGSKSPDKNPASVEEAEKQLAKDAKKSGREAKKAKKEAYKRYWNAQSKEARKSVERNARNQKKRTRKMKRRN